MEIATLVLEYIKVLIYPIFIGFTVLYFRNEIRSIIGGKFTAKYKDLSLVIEQKQREIDAMETNYAEITTAVSDELKIIEKNESWKGLDSKIDRVLSALGKVKLGSGEHTILRFIRDKGGTTTKVDVIKEFAGPKQGMHPHDFDVAKEGVKNTIEILYKKGLIAISDKHELKIHPWIVEKIDIA